MEQNISVERALEMLRSAVQPLPPVRRRATEAEGFVLAEDVFAPIHQPPWPRSPLDGYALRAAYSAPGAAKRVVATICAGSCYDGPVGPKEAVRLMTGAPIPPECDCVIAQEDTDGGTETVLLHRALRPWENYCFTGEDYRRGALLLPQGTRLRGLALGLLASAGLLRRDVELAVRPRLRAALICTGDELVPADTPELGPGKIYSSNAWLLASRLRMLDVELTVLRETFSDDAPALAETVRSALPGCDLVLTTGGVSVGAKDILHETLPLLGAERLFWRVRLKPGSPLMFSLVDGKPLLSLSGNPFAAAATFELFARPLLAALEGCGEGLPTAVRATLDADFPKRASVPRYVRGRLTDGRLSLPAGHSSGQLASGLGTNCLAEIPAGASCPAGTEVRAWLL